MKRKYSFRSNLLIKFTLLTPRSHKFQIVFTNKRKFYLRRYKLVKKKIFLNLISSNQIYNQIKRILKISRQIFSPISTVYFYIWNFNHLLPSFLNIKKNSPNSNNSQILLCFLIQFLNNNNKFKIRKIIMKINQFYISLLRN